MTALTVTVEPSFQVTFTEERFLFICKWLLLNIHQQAWDHSWILLSWNDGLLNSLHLHPTDLWFEVLWTEFDVPGRGLPADQMERDFDTSLSEVGSRGPRDCQSDHLSPPQPLNHLCQPDDFDSVRGRQTLKIYLWKWTVEFDSVVVGKATN